MTEQERPKLGLSTSEEVLAALKQKRAQSRAGYKRGKDGKMHPPSYLVATWLRAKLLLTVAEKWELVFLGVAPLMFVVVAAIEFSGLPLIFGALAFIVLGFYVGWFFAVWVFLDRRFDEQNWMQFKNSAMRLMGERDSRQLARMEATASKVEASRRAKAAILRGKERARAARTTPPGSGRAEQDAPAFEPLFDED